MLIALFVVRFYRFFEPAYSRRVNGLLIVDKPAGMTSHDVVSCLRRVTGESSIGHLGTLDPMATGVLPMLLGKFTRLAQFFGGLEKTYTGTIRLGFSTDTYDATGQATSEPRSVGITLDALRSQAAHFHGEMEQTPPAFSAKKIDGKPAYKLARAGKDVVMKPVRITILQFEILAADNDGVEFVMRVSAGGYVRSVAHDLGQKLGCGAHLATLRRVAAGPFVVEQALTLDAIAELARAGTLVDAMPHPRHMLPELPSVGADEATAGRMRNGMAVNLPEFSRVSLVKVFEGQRHLIGIAKRVAGTLFQPTVVIG